MTIDLRSALRRRKPDKRLTQLSARQGQESDWSLPEPGPAALLIDTTVYIHQASDRLPTALSELLDRARLFHCTVALAEIVVGIANAEPTRPGWSALRDHYLELFELIPDVRVLTPDAQTWLEAGIVAGTLTRLQGYQAHQRRACLNDALIFLTAAKAGLPVLTANRVEFDLIQQLVPEGRFLHY